MAIRVHVDANLDSLPADIIEYKLLKHLPLKIVDTKRRSLIAESKTPSSILAPVISCNAVNLAEWFVVKLNYRSPFTSEELLNASSEAGHINLVKWSIANSCVSPSETCWILAAKNGHLDLLKYLAEFDVTTQKKSYQNYSSAILAAAASGGHMSIVQWGRNIGLKWDGAVTDALAGRGALADLRWAFELGCPASTRITEYAAQGGHIEVLQFLVGKGCYWTERTCASACKANQHQVIDWLRQNRCPWDYCKANSLAAAVERKQKRKST